MSPPPGIRFSPPRVEPTPELRWVLGRAFGEPGERHPAGDPAEVARLLRRLDLGPRIAARIPPDRLVAELGEAGEQRLGRLRRRVVAEGLRLEALARQVAGVAAEAELPLLLVKGMALRAAGVLAEGSRRADDVDVLVPAGRERELDRRLTAIGFVAARSSDKDHQLAPRVAPSGALLEIHRSLPGIRRAGEGRFAGFAELRDAGAIRPLAGWPGECFLPTPGLAALHAAVHGLAQHGWRPDSYPGLRTLADLIDLGVPGAGDLAAERRDLEVDVSTPELAALGELCRRLATGDAQLLDEPPADSGAATLLHHLLAGALDDDYRRSLRFADLRRPLSDRRGPAAALRAVVWTLFPPLGDLEAMHGRRSRGAAERLRWRLARPFDLLARAVRYRRSARAVERTSEGGASGEAGRPPRRAE